MDGFTAFLQNQNHHVVDVDIAVGRHNETLHWQSYFCRAEIPQDFLQDSPCSQLLSVYYRREGERGL